MVPQGFPNDSFPIMVESGERVQVTPAGQSGTIENKSGTIVEASSGLNDFMVPQGFPNDSFPIMVESGERVQVTPANQEGNTRTDELLEMLIETIQKKPVAYTIMFDRIEMSQYVEEGDGLRVRN